MPLANINMRMQTPTASDGTLTSFNADCRNAKSPGTLQQEAIATSDIKQRHLFGIKHKFSQEVTISRPGTAFVVIRILCPPLLQIHRFVDHAAFMYLYCWPKAINCWRISS